MIFIGELVRVGVLGILYMITFGSEDFHSLHFTSRMTDEGTLGHFNFRSTRRGLLKFSIDQLDIGFNYML